MAAYHRRSLSTGPRAHTAHRTAGGAGGAEGAGGRRGPEEGDEGAGGEQGQAGSDELLREAAGVPSRPADRSRTRRARPP
eukprot:254123-Prymnesium_polylepis.1